jgi:hypothetical protein
VVAGLAGIVVTTASQTTRALGTRLLAGSKCAGLRTGLAFSSSRLPLVLAGGTRWHLGLRTRYTTNAAPRRPLPPSKGLLRVPQKTPGSVGGRPPTRATSRGKTTSTAARRRIADYEDVGLTWWVERLGWFRGSVDDMRQRIQAGPPRR